MSILRETVFSRRMLKGLVSSFLTAFGSFALLLGILDVLWPNKFGFGYQGLLSLAVVSLFLATIRSFPRTKIARSFSIPDTKITIKVGDLFKEEEHLVIGMNDVFDTEIGDIISKDSIQGQFLAKIYGNDRLRLNKDLDVALAGIAHRAIDQTKIKGKNKRYPLGTTAVLMGEGRKYFCCAYSTMGSDFKASSDVGKLWNSLEKLWDSIRESGAQAKVSVPVIGADLARVPGASHENLIKVILLSFIINSRVQPITKEFVLVIHKNNVEKVNLLKLRDFLAMI